MSKDFEGLASNLEEADSRIVLHARDATVRGYNQLTFCVLTQIFLSFNRHTGNIFCQNIWMFSGTSRRKRYIPVHKITLPARGEEEVTASFSCHDWV